MTNVTRRAARLHHQAIIIDAHNDHLGRKTDHLKPLDFTKTNRRYHCDTPRLLKAGVTAGLFYVGGNDLTKSLGLIQRTLAEVDNHPRELILVKSAADITRANRLNQLGIVMIWEGAMALSDDPDILGLIHRLGVRAITLTHGQGGRPFALQGTHSHFGYCTAEDRDSFRRTCKGLTPFARQAVKQMNQLGILIDVAHINDAAFYEVMELSEKPVACTHGGAFACCPHSRCLTNEQIKTLARKQGVLGIAFYHKFIHTKKPTIPRIVDHIAHVADLVGIDHVGIGSDFDGLPGNTRPVIRSADQLPLLTEAMIQRGFHDNEIKKVLGRNFLRILKATIH